MARAYSLRIGPVNAVAHTRSMTDNESITDSRVFGRGKTIQESMPLNDVAVNSAQEITHGSQITLDNVGYQAYFDTDLGRNLQLSDLEQIDGVHFLSDFLPGGVGGSPGNNVVMYAKHFTEAVLFDVDYVTLRGCLMDVPPSAFAGGTHQVGSFLDYCTVDPLSVGDECMRFESWSANRCFFRGCSDGAKINGGETPIFVTECLIRVQMASGEDHNDTLQNVGGSGQVYIERCNLSVNPEGGLIPGVGGPDAVVMSADMAASSVFHLEVNDCLLDATNAVFGLRFYDGGLTPNITYQATGNLFVRSAAGPVHRGAANITPTSQIVWSNNRWADDLSLIPLT